MSARILFGLQVDTPGSVGIVTENAELKRLGLSAKTKCSPSQLDADTVAEKDGLSKSAPVETKQPCSDEPVDSDGELKIQDLCVVYQPPKTKRSLATILSEMQEDLRLRIKGG